MDKEFVRNIAEKEIAMGVDVPYSREVDYITFSRVLKDDRVVASYKRSPKIYYMTLGVEI